MTSRTVQEIESEIKAIKDVNANWKTEHGVIALIAELQREKNNLNISQPSATQDFQSFEEMLRIANITNPNPHTIDRMIKKFGVLVDLAYRFRNYSILSDVYHQADGLPNTQTANELYLNGFALDKHIIKGNDCRQICFNDGLPYLMKVCTEIELSRLKQFEQELQSTRFLSPPSIIPCISFENKTKRYIFMPLHPVVLENMPSLGSMTLQRFFTQLSDAIHFLHNLGFAHMDIKPSNILISTSGDFILADLGSLQRFDARTTSTTECYLPKEYIDRINGVKASATIDWWMLAITMLEKVCGWEVGLKAESLRKAEIKNKLGDIDSEEILNDLLPRLT